MVVSTKNSHQLSFHNKYSKESKSKYDKPNPYFNVWIRVLGKKIPEFDTSLFKQNNPSVIQKVQEIRQKSSITMETIDGTVLQKYLIFAISIGVFTFKRAIRLLLSKNVRIEIFLFFTFEKCLFMCYCNKKYIVNTHENSAIC